MNNPHTLYFLDDMNSAQYMYIALCVPVKSNPYIVVHQTESYVKTISIGIKRRIPVLGVIYKTRPYALGADSKMTPKPLRDA